MRYFFEIAYNGAPYNGWQSQNNATGVQAVLERVLSTAFREPIEVVGSGRTDTGVHCEQQFFHADISRPFSPQDMMHKLNAFLPKDIAIGSIRPVRSDAHARYSALSRTYQYRITRRKNPFLEGLALYFFKPVDIQTLNTAASLLLGKQDFESFSKVNTDVNHFLCDITRAEWQEKGDLLEFTITANRFLRGMVRATVGTLLDVGTGRISLDDLRAILLSRDRRKAGANVPPQGLYLVRVEYPEDVFINLPEHSGETPAHA